MCVGVGTFTLFVIRMGCFTLNSIFIGMAYDWINGNLYWANSQQNTIVVASLKDASQKVFLSNVSDVRGIAVEPKQG